MPYWIESTLAATPAVLWIYVGLGVPWALVTLPRVDWRDRLLVVALAFALGPALLTAWMFALGSVSLLRLDLTLGGTVFLALVGVALAWRRSQRVSAAPTPIRPFAWDEQWLIGIIVIALVVRWLVVAFWTFTAYDALWVFGYQGRLYTLLGTIPASIDYYPQFLPLQYTFLQMIVGGIDDHAARAVLPWLQIGSILAVYVLGSKLINRRAGLIAAAFWALFPQVALWSRFGDLEIPLTFTFTLAAAFFLLAWTGQQHARRYAIIAGVCFGIAMWTKPTAGAFVWGVLLLLLVELVRVRFDLARWLPRFRLAVLTGVASAPLGGVWYIRNLLLGHSVIDFPPGFWLTQALRSGDEFGWLLLALSLLLVYLVLTRRADRRMLVTLLSGLALVLAGVLPSILDETRIAAPASRMTVIEYGLLAAGAALLGVTLWRRYGTTLHGEARTLMARVGWALLLALPYFVTWFWSYSYHYRLSFAIVPLLILPSAVLIACWLPAEQVERWRGWRRSLHLTVLTLLSLPGIVLALYDVDAGWDWLWSGELPDDHARYEIGNAALMNIVHGLELHPEQHDEPMVVFAPGIDRLPFFFPTEDIRVDATPTRFSDFDVAGKPYFVFGMPESAGAYIDANIPNLDNQVVSALGRSDIMRYAWGRDDGTFRYDVYEPSIANRHEMPFIKVPPEEGDVLFGDFVRYLGYDIGDRYFWVGRRLIMHLYWEVLRQPNEDYMIYIHLRDPDGNVQAAWDGPVARVEDGTRYYSTLLWEPGEIIIDERLLVFTNDQAPIMRGYKLVIGMYNLETGERVPITIDGEPWGDGYTLPEKMRIEAIPESELD